MKRKLIKETKTHSELTSLLSTRKNFKSVNLEEGGSFNRDFLGIVYNIVDEFIKWDTNSGCTLQITAGNDKYHQNNSPNSLHTTGNAIDLVVSNNCYEGLFAILDKYKKDYPGFNYLDERTKKSDAWTGPHIHVSYRPNNPENFGTGGSGTGGNSNTSSSSSSKSFDELGFLNPALDVLKTTGQAVKKSFDKTVSTMTENNLELDKKIISEIKRINNLMKK